MNGICNLNLTGKLLTKNLKEGYYNKIKQHTIYDRLFQN